MNIVISHYHEISFGAQMSDNRGDLGGVTCRQKMVTVEYVKMNGMKNKKIVPVFSFISLVNKNDFTQERFSQQFLSPLFLC